MNYKLVDLVDIVKIKSLMESFCEAVEIGSAIIDLEGNVLIGARWQRICTEFHRVNEATCKRCIESDTELANELGKGKKFSLYKCKNGMTDAASPIIIEGEHIANAFIGQFLLEPPDENFFRRQAAEFGLDEQDYLNALSDVPVVPEDKISPIMDFLVSFAETAAQMGLDAVRQKQTEAKLQEYQENLENLVEQRTAELAKSENRIKKILETSYEGFWFIDNDIKTLDVNKAMCDILGRSRDEIVGKTIFQFTDEENTAIFKKQVMRREKGAASAYEVALLRPDGTNIPCLFNATPFFDESGKKIGAFAMVTDITERKDKERIALLSSKIGEILIAPDSLRDKLQKCTDAFVSHLDAALVRIWIVDDKENMLNLKASSGLYTRINGTRSRVQVGKKKIGIIAQKAEPYINENVVKDSLVDDKAWVKKNKLVGFQGYPMLVEGKVVGVLALFFRFLVSKNMIDSLPSISNAIAVAIERERAEQALQKQEKQFRELLESAPDAMIIVDGNGEIKLINRQTEKLFGYTKEELIGREIEILVADYIKRNHKKLRTNFMRETATRDMNINREFRARRKDGSEFPVDISLSPIETEAGIWISAAVRDITERKRAEEELVKLSEVVKQSPISVVITNKEGTIEYVNPKFEEVSGYTSEEAIGQNPRILNAGVQPEEYFKGLWDTIVGGNIWSGELCNKKKNGDIYWESASISPVKNSDGNIVKFVAVKEDITERKKIEGALIESKDRLSMALRGGNLGLWDWNPVTGELITNDIWEEMLGYEPGTFGNTTEKWNSLLHPEDIEPTYAIIEKHMKGETELYKSEHRLIRKDGEWNWILDVGKVVSRDDEGNATRFIGIHIDINETKQLQAELENAKLTAEDANKAKSDFLARMSHEIRTPMNAIIGLSHLALQTELSAKQKDYLKKIHASSYNLLGIINDILDFSKIEAGKLDIEHIDFGLEDVMNNLSNLLAVKAQEKGLELLFAIDKNVPNFLVGDPLRLGQILINLGNNAMKFTEKGEIIVRGELVREDDEKVELEFAVQDTGIGIPQDKINSLFQEFSQVDGSTTRKYGGTGLGLAICKRLSELMGGTIWVESEAGRGSTFRFTVIFGKQAEQKEKSYKPAVDLEGMKVLVVDDNQDARDVFTSYLESFSFNVTGVDSGKAAIEELERTSQVPGSESYKLILMDWSMPGMDGIEASVRIKDDYRIKQKPKIVMVTAFGREEIMNKAEKAGLDAFLIKPVNQSVLFDTVMSVFGKEVAAPEEAEQKQGDYEEKIKNIHGAKILLVEDNEINQQVALELLEKYGFIVSVANNGKEGIEVLEGWEYDLILMDMQMPVMDGYEATRRIRENPKYKDLPIVAMTAHAMAGDREKSLAAGMNDHVTKPIDPAQLYSALVNWIDPDKVDTSFAMEPDESVPEEEEVKLPETIPGIDVATGVERVGGNKTLYRKLLIKFRDSNRSVVDDIRAALKSNDMELTRRLAHTVKGVAGNIAADEVQARAAEVENAVKNEDFELADKLLPEFSKSLEFVFSSIGKFEEESEKKAVEFEETGTGDKIVDVSAATALLKDLKELLEDDFTEAENRLQSLKTSFKGSKFIAALQKLQNEMEDYDFEVAMITIDEIILKLENQ